MFRGLYRKLLRILEEIKVKKFNPIKYKPRQIIHKSYFKSKDNDSYRLRRRDSTLRGSDNISVYFDNCFRLFPLYNIHNLRDYLNNVLFAKLRFTTKPSIGCREYYKSLSKISETIITKDYKDLYNIIYSNFPFYLKSFKMKVFCFSLLEFEKIVKHFWDNLSDINNNVAIISITNPKELYEGDWTTKHPIQYNPKYSIDVFYDCVLNIEFEDDSEDFDVYMANKIVEFVDNNIGKDFYVHCIMGKSRSQAVCRYILETYPDLYSYGREYENPLKTANPHVLSTLKRVKRAKIEIPPKNS